MTRYRFELATGADDEALRAFLAAADMPGTLRLSFRRDPDYFAPGGAFGPFNQTMLCRDAASGEVVGCGSRSVREVLVDGGSTPIGYLSMLRSAEHVRSGLLLSRGYRYLRGLHEDGRAPCYLTTIAEGNDTALSILTSGRGSLPTYHPAGDYHTFAIATPRRTRGRAGPRSGLGLGAITNPERTTDVVPFLADFGKRRQFFPRYGDDDFTGPDATFTGIEADDVVTAADGTGTTVGTMALWDQRAFRQTVVTGYQAPLDRLRPLHNATALLHRRPRLPAPGSVLAYGTVAIPAIVDDDPATFDGLLNATLDRARERGLDYVLLGCHRDDPLRPLAAARSFLTYTTKVFLVTWDDDGVVPDHDRAVPMYLELGCL